MRALTENEILRVEAWASGTKLSEMLFFFEELPREFLRPTPIPLGCSNQFEILVEGFTPKSKLFRQWGSGTYLGVWLCLLDNLSTNKELPCEFKLIRGIE
jgi:hypothetical protein